MLLKHPVKMDHSRPQEGNAESGASIILKVNRNRIVSFFLNHTLLPPENN